MNKNSPWNLSYCSKKKFTKDVKVKVSEIQHESQDKKNTWNLYCTLTAQYYTEPKVNKLFNACCVKEFAQNYAMNQKMT